MGDDATTVAPRCDGSQAVRAMVEQSWAIVEVDGRSQPCVVAWTGHPIQSVAAAPHGHGMVARGRFAVPKRSMVLSRHSIGIVVAILALGPSAAHADRALNRSFEAVWDLTTSVGHRDMNELGQDPGTGVGVGLRLAGSLWKLITVDLSAPRPGLRLTDWWKGGIGLGYLRSEDKIAPLWAAVRVEATLRLDYAASPDVDVFVRAGYLTGIDAAGRGLYNGYDALFATAGARVRSVLAEAGYGVNATVADLSYLLIDLEYAFRDLGIRYVGLRVERYAGAGTDVTSVSLTLAAH